MLLLQETSISQSTEGFDPHPGADQCGHQDCHKGRCSANVCPVLESFGKQRQYDRGDVIFWDGDDADFVYLIEQGVVRGTKLLGDGRRQVARFVFAGEILEYCRRPQFPFTAEAITPVRLVAFPRHRLERQMSVTPCLRNLIMQIIIAELDSTREQLLALGRLSATERVAYFLRHIAEHIGTDEDGAFDLPMSRQDIADYLGLTIETVSRIISKLKRSGKIRLQHCGRVVIADLEDFSLDLLADVA